MSDNFIPTRETTVEEWQEAFRSEQRMWQANGMPPPEALNFNIFNMDLQLHTLMELVREKLDIDKDEWDYRYRCKKLEILREYRQEFIRAKIMQGVHDNHKPNPPIV